MEINADWLNTSEMHPWDVYSRVVMKEWRQCAAEGLMVDDFRARAEAITALPMDGRREEMAHRFFLDIRRAPMRSDYPYTEPDDLNEIRALRDLRPYAPVAPRDLVSSLRGALWGRVCGCLLGKPVEGWTRADIARLALCEGNGALDRYLLSHPGFSDGGGAFADQTRGFMPVDDDINYTVMADKRIIGLHGRDFSTLDVAREWLACQPIDLYCTAERRAYRNCVIGFRPPLSALYKNPSRELIGAQIRADWYGLINPCDPQSAADMAWRDARVSHVKNGVYGAMLVAATLAAAFSASDALDAVMAGLHEIPASSRLYEAVSEVCGWARAGLNAKECIERIHARYGEKDDFDCIHVIPNAMIVFSCVLCARTYAQAVGECVLAGFDTDCNAATAGCIYGLLHGDEAVGKAWRTPVAEGINTTILGAQRVTVEELVADALKMIRSVNA